MPPGLAKAGAIILLDLKFSVEIKGDRGDAYHPEPGQLE